MAISSAQSKGTLILLPSRKMPGRHLGARYVQAIDLGVAAERIDTITSFARAGEFGVKTEGSAAAGGVRVLLGMFDPCRSEQRRCPHAFPTPAPLRRPHVYQRVPQE